MDVDARTLQTRSASPPAARHRTSVTGHCAIRGCVTLRRGRLGLFALWRGLDADEVII